MSSIRTFTSSVFLMIPSGPSLLEELVLLGHWWNTLFGSEELIPNFFHSTWPFVLDHCKIFYFRFSYYFGWRFVGLPGFSQRELYVWTNCNLYWIRDFGCWLTRFFYSKRTLFDIYYVLEHFVGPSFYVEVAVSYFQPCGDCMCWENLLTESYLFHLVNFLGLDWPFWGVDGDKNGFYLLFVIAVWVLWWNYEIYRVIMSGYFHYSFDIPCHLHVIMKLQHVFFCPVQCDAGKLYYLPPVFSVSVNVGSHCHVSAGCLMQLIDPDVGIIFAG